jgi:hypothetical protein
MKPGQCVFCGGTLELLDHTQPGRTEACEHCQKDLHCCRQCRFYDRHVRQSCHEPRAEFVANKEGGNFCTWFEFQGGSGEADPERQQAEDAKSELEKLFK